MLLLATEVWRSHGGIQRYMRMIVRILADRGEPFAVLSLLDGDKNRPVDTRSHCTTCEGSKWRFCLEALRLARRRSARELLVGHVGLLPIAWILRRMNLTDRYAVVLHGIEAWRRLSWATRIAARGASHIIATTSYTAREFCFLNGVDATRCAVIPLAAGTCTSAFRRTAPEGELKLLMVSRLSVADRYKGADTVLRAVRLARDAGVPLTLDIVGSGDDLDRLEDLVRSLGVREVVHLRGSLPDLEVERLYHQSDVFVMPSKKEGFGIVYLEAMAAGLPCIGANHGGTPEVIEHGESGFLIEYGDADQLLLYVQALMESPGLYVRMSAAASRRATETLTLKVMTESWRSLIESLSNRPTRDTQSLDPEGRDTTLPRVAS
jgi:phosphatidyl-myo-inositol dimannoside synthase